MMLVCNRDLRADSRCWKAVSWADLSWRSRCSFSIWGAGGGGGVNSIYGGRGVRCVNVGCVESNGHTGGRGTTTYTYTQHITHNN
jgi:hypothetical protein